MHPMVIVVPAVSLLASTNASQGDPALERVKELQSRLNDAFVAGDEEAIRALMAEDNVSITTFYGRPLTLDEQMDAHDEATYSGYTPGEVEPARLGEDVIQIRYTADRTGRYRGEELSPRIFVSAIWVRRDDRWRQRFYQETQLD